MHMIARFHEDRRHATAVTLHADGGVEARADGAMMLTVLAGCSTPLR